MSEEKMIAGSFFIDEKGNKVEVVDAKARAELNAQKEANEQQDAEIAKRAKDNDLAAVAKSGSYNDLSDKPTIPTVPSTLPNPNVLTFTGAVNDTYDGSEPKSVAIPAVPESLKNPHPLTINGQSYDGSEAVNVTVEGGGSEYTLPIASATTLGGVKPEAKTDAMNQPVGVDANGRLYAPAAALPTDEQVGTAVNTYLTENGVKCNDVWVDLGTITVSEGEEPKILSWPLTGKIKKFYMWGMTYGHTETGNKQLLPRGTLQTNNGGPVFTGGFNWPANSTSTKYYMDVYAEKVKTKYHAGWAWAGHGGMNSFNESHGSYLTPVTNASQNMGSVIAVGAYYLDAVIPVGSQFQTWVVYE